MAAHRAFGSPVILDEENEGWNTEIDLHGDTIPLTLYAVPSDSTATKLETRAHFAARYKKVNPEAANTPEEELGQERASCLPLGSTSRLKAGVKARPNYPLARCLPLRIWGLQVFNVSRDQRQPGEHFPACLTNRDVPKPAFIPPGRFTRLRLTTEWALNLQLLKVVHVSLHN